MSNFKVGEKVVFVMQKGAKPNKNHRIPNDNEILTITGVYRKDNNFFYLSGYEFDLVGCRQPIHKKHFRKLDHQFSEDVIAEIIKQVKKESLTLSN